MIKILFLRNNKVLLPEVDAYLEYFKKTSGYKAYDSSKLSDEYDLKDFDVLWEFKGVGGIRQKAKGQILIHEYASLSIGRFPHIKNIMKRVLNPKPDLRIFLNEKVKEGFGFKDGIAYCYRDMGIDKSFIQTKSNNKEYDFVYVGSMSKAREFDKFLKVFTQKNNGKLCLIGNVNDSIYKKYKNNKDLIFTGKVPYLEVPRIASKAVYGINFVPDKYPYNVQTSTKLLEYLALGLKVITTDYQWVKKFENEQMCLFYKLDYYNLNFDIEDINKFAFKSNFIAENYTWDRIIERSGIIEKLNNMHLC